MSNFNEHNYLAHYGVIGMKWGVRKYQNKDGSLTELGKKRYAEFAGSDGEIHTNADSYNYAKTVSRVAEAKRRLQNATTTNKFVYKGEVIKRDDGSESAITIYKDKDKHQKELDNALNAWQKMHDELKTKYSEVEHTDVVKDGAIIAVTLLTDKYGKVYMSELEAQMPKDWNLNRVQYTNLSYDPWAAARAAKGMK